MRGLNSTRRPSREKKKAKIWEVQGRGPEKETEKDKKKRIKKTEAPKGHPPETALKIVFQEMYPEIVWGYRPNRQGKTQMRTSLR